MSNSNFIRVTKHNPCPVCGKPDWCLISRDGKAAICARTESDKPAGNKGAGWVHNLEKQPPAPYIPPAPQAAKAPPDRLDSVYAAFLQCLSLSQAHRENLRRRGLADPEINSLGYKTLPAHFRYYLTDQLQSKGYELSGVPGFYPDKVTYKYLLAGPPGILIPVRDAIKRQIQGMQIRRDNATENKYVWLSSSKYPGGSSPGTPIHAALTDLPGINYGKPALDGVLITEGPLKADIAALRLGCLTLAVAGVSNWHGVLPIIKALQPPPGRVIIAFDMDKQQNEYVRTYLDELTVALLRQGIRTYEADWDIRKKGIDDLCLTSR